MNYKQKKAKFLCESLQEMLTERGVRTGITLPAWINAGLTMHSWFASSVDGEDISDISRVIEFKRELTYEYEYETPFKITFTSNPDNNNLEPFLVFGNGSVKIRINEKFLKTEESLNVFLSTMENFMELIDGELT